MPAEPAFVERLTTREELKEMYSDEEFGFDDDY